jgi:hypothetical protein
VATQHSSTIRSRKASTTVDLPALEVPFRTTTRPVTGASSPSDYSDQAGRGAGSSAVATRWVSNAVSYPT